MLGVVCDDNMMMMSQQDCNVDVLDRNIITGLSYPPATSGEKARKVNIYCPMLAGKCVSSPENGQ